MRDVNIQPQSWTVDDDDEDEGGETEAAARSLNFSYARA